jgi:MFS family permease
MAETPIRLMTQNRLAAALRNFADAFLDIRRSPRALWIVIGAYVIESTAYFGVLTLMTLYLGGDLGWGDHWAGLTVSFFTMTVTLFMLGIGSYAEKFGLRRAIILALTISTLARIGYAGTAYLGHGALTIVLVLATLFFTAIGSAILQPVCYSGVKQYTDERTNAMGYGFIYAFMNLGIVAIGALSAWMRPAVQALKDGAPTHPQFAGGFLQFLADHSPSGVVAVNWACAGITALALFLFLPFMTRRTEAAKIRPDPNTERSAGPTLPLGQRLRQFFGDGPFSNPRFIFFIFMLLPVRTLFAHQWLTMPEYIVRAYDKDVGDHMEWLVNWINPGIIFIGVPLATAFTRRINVYTMMMIGTLVSAAPTFLLALGSNLTLLITYFVVFSIGEALWSARFYEYSSELAPPGRVSQYMGLANIPWLLAKGTTGFYSGYVLATWCPKDVPKTDLHPEGMWILYGFIAMSTPVGLWLARHWVRRGLHSHSNPAPAS